MMKLFNTINWGRIVFFTAFCLSLHGVSSCSKSEPSPDPVNPEDLTKLTVQVLGIVDLEEVELAIKPTASTGVGRAATEDTRTEDAGTFESYDGFDAITSVAQSAVQKKKVVVSAGSIAVKSGTSLMAAAMGNGIKYRLLLYSTKTGSEVFWKSVELSSAGAIGQTVDVVKGESYKWYAFSYNTTASIPDVDPNNPVIAAGNNDLLYASGAVTVTGAGTVNKPLAISFVHKMAQIVVEFDARGMFTDNITALGMTFGGNMLKTANMTIKTGAMSAPVAYSPAAIDISKFVNVETNYNDRKKAYFYTAETGTMTNMKVFLNNLTITIENGTSRVFPAMSKEFNFASVPAVVGKSYTAKIDLIESPVIVNATGLTNVKWGRANLFHKGDGQRNPYRFRMQNSGVYNSTNQDLFRFLEALPGNAAIIFFGGFITNYTQVDPCGLVHPVNTWRTPTRAEYTALSAVTTGRTFSGSDYVQYTGAASNVGSPYPNKDLRFDRHGWHQKGMSGIIYYPWVFTPRDGFYWSSTPNYRFEVTGTSNPSTSVGESYVLGFGFSSTPNNWGSVRCVRTAGN